MLFSLNSSKHCDVTQHYYLTMHFKPFLLLGLPLTSSSSVVVIQFLSGVVPLTEMAGFTPFLLQLLALGSSTCLVSGHPPSSNQALCLLFHLLLPGLPQSSSLSLATHFKIQSNPQNTIVIPPQHMPILSNSIRCC